MENCVHSSWEGSNVTEIMNVTPKWNDPWAKSFCQGSCLIFWTIYGSNLKLGEKGKTSQSSPTKNAICPKYKELCRWAWRRKSPVFWSWWELTYRTRWKKNFDAETGVPYFESPSRADEFNVFWLVWAGQPFPLSLSRLPNEFPSQDTVP